MVIDTTVFPPEVEESNGRLIVKAYEQGWKRNARGQRFCGSGLGNHTTGVRIDVYDSLRGLSRLVYGWCRTLRAREWAGPAQADIEEW